MITHYICTLKYIIWWSFVTRRLVYSNYLLQDVQGTQAATILSFDYLSTAWSSGNLLMSLFHPSLGLRPPPSSDHNLSFHILNPNSSTTNPARMVKAAVLGAAGEYWARFETSANRIEGGIGQPLALLLKLEGLPLGHWGVILWTRSFTSIHELGPVAWSVW